MKRKNDVPKKMATPLVAVISGERFLSLRSKVDATISIRSFGLNGNALWTRRTFNANRRSATENAKGELFVQAN